MGYTFTFNFSEKDIDFNARADYYFNYDKFLLNEFFNSTDLEMVGIMSAYRRKYGQSAYDYVIKKYYWDWRSGYRDLSNVQYGRIISLMPDHLNDYAKARLSTIREEARHKLGIEEFLGAIKNGVNSYFLNQKIFYSKEKINSEQDIINIFKKEIERVQTIQIYPQAGNYNPYHFKVLTEEEKIEALLIAKYIVFVKLQKQFDQIEKDFKTFLQFVFKRYRGIITVSYFISVFKLNIDLSKRTINEFVFPKLIVDEIAANTQFNIYADKYLATELVSINHQANKSVVDAYLNSNDLKLFFEHYETLSFSENDVKMKSVFNGEGGVLNIEIEMKSLKMLKTTIIKSSSKILICSILYFGIFILALSNDKLFLFAIGGGLYVLFLYLSMLSDEFKKIKNLKAEIKKYG